MTKLFNTNHYRFFARMFANSKDLVEFKGELIRFFMNENAKFDIDLFNRYMAMQEAIAKRSMEFREAKHKEYQKVMIQ